MKNRRIPMNIIVTIVVSIILVLGYQSINLIRISHNLDRQIKESTLEITVEEQKLKSLQEEQEHMNSLENVEKVAREKLNLVKEDEIVFKDQP